MTTYWLAGFEENSISIQGGGLADYSTGSPSISSSYAKNGTYSFRSNGSGAACYVYKLITGSATTIGAACYVYFVTLPTSGESNLFDIRTNATIHCGINVYYSGGNCYFAGTAGGTAQVGPQISTGQWYRLEFKADVSGSTWTCDWWVNGSAQTQATYSTTASYFIRAYIGGRSALTYDYYFDNVFVTDNSAMPIGDYTVEVLRPGSDGTHNAGTNIIEDNAGTDIGTTTAYDKINSSTPSSTTYLRQAGTGSYYAEVNLTDMTSGKTPKGLWGVLAYTSASTSANRAATFAWNGSTEYGIWGTSGTTTDYSDGSTSSLYYKSADIGITLNETNVNALKARFGYSGDVNPIPYLIDLWFYLVHVTAGATGTGAATLENATISGDGDVSIAATSSKTLDNITISGASAVSIAGTLSKTLDNATLSGMGSVAIAGALSKTLDNATLSGTGTLASPVLGTGAATLGALTLSSSAKLENEGELAATLGALTLSGTASVTSTVVGTGAATLGNVTLSGTAAVVSPATGTGAATLENATLSGTGAITSPPVTGTSAQTLDALTLSGAGAVAVAGALSKTLDNATLSGTGTVLSPVLGTGAATLGALTLSGTASVTSTVLGTGAATLAALTLSGTAAVTTVELGSGLIYAPDIFYTKKPRKKLEEDEAIMMVLISLLDEAW